MKKLFCCAALLLSIVSTTYANNSTYGYKDPSRKDYYDEWGQHQGYSKRQPYSDRTQHYNVWGQNQGYSKQDPYTGEIKHYDAWGQYEGSTR